MYQPSTNKWAAVPLKSTKTTISFDNTTVDINADPIVVKDEPTGRKYDPCVAFISGTPLSNTGSRNSRSSSISSSGNATPLRSSGRVSPERKPATTIKTYDSCVSFVAGKPNIVSSIDEIPEESKSQGVPPIQLKNALSRAQNKRVYSVGKRLAPKPIQGVNKPGAVTNIAGLFGGANNDNNNNESKVNKITRKQSATCVLRDDFVIKSIANRQNSLSSPTEEAEPPLRVSNEAKINIQDPARNQRQDLTSFTQKLEQKSTPSNRKFSSSTSQATLIESQVVSNEDGVFSVVSPTTWKDNDVQKNYLSSQHLEKRKCSFSSSVENSDDDDSHVDSAEENELNNWEDRRRSYLAASAKNTKTSSSLDATAEADDEDSDVNANTYKPSTQKSVKERDTSNAVIKEGHLNRKLAHANDRKKQVSRTWRPIYAILKGHRLFCYQDGGSDACVDAEIIQPIPIRSSIIEIANDYLKKKNVFRILTSHGNEYLFQAENISCMNDWVEALRGANPDKESLMKRPNEHKNSQTKSPQTTNKGFRFLGGKSLSKQQQQQAAPAPTIPSPKNTFGNLISSVPMSDLVKNVPVVIVNCCNIIEERGLNQKGLYRVPGNSVLCNHLKKELDSKDPDEIDWTDDIWYELNNICSLVKQFLRELLDPMIPSNMYSKFIQANRIKDSSERLTTIKQLIWSLPEYHLESINFLSHHLKNLADNCSKNSMTERNIALILAPNIVRTSEVTEMVQDMSDQYQIVELLIRQCNWIFNNSDDCPSLPEEVETTSSENIIASSMKDNLMETLQNQQQMVSKVEFDTSKKEKENSGKFSSLKSNFSMRLRNNKNISPRTLKKTSKTSPAGSIDNQSQEEEESDGNDTSESINTSPILEVKAKNNFFKSSKEIIQNANSNASNVISIKKSFNGSGAAKISTFQPNSDITISIKHRSPDLSPQLSRDEDMRASARKLSGKTMSRLNQVSVGRQEDSFSRTTSHDDGSDAGSDVNKLGNIQDFRKGSYDSSTGSSPSMLRRFNLAKKLSVEQKEEKSNNMLVVTATNDATGESHENVMDSDKPCVIKRTTGRRNKLTISPNTSKRPICTIMPGDDSFEEKVRALIDPEYSGEMKEAAHSEMLQPTDIPQAEAAPKKTFAPISLSLNMNESSNGTNAEWWLSDNRSASSKLKRAPKDKRSALNIISNAIDFRKQTDQKNNGNDKVSSASINNNQNNNNDGSNYDSPPNTSMTKRIGIPQKLTFNPELSGRVNQFNQQREECERKVTDVLGAYADSSTAVDPTAVKSKSDQIQFYLEKVSRLINDSEGIDQEVPQINDILKYFQNKVTVTEPTSPTGSGRGGGSIDINNSSSGTKVTLSSSSNNDSTQATSTTTTSRQINLGNNERQAPMLDSSYSNLDYNKLSAR